MPADVSANAEVTINAPAGLKSVKVKIQGGNNGFTQTLEGTQIMFGINLIEGEELVDNTDFEELISGIAPGLTVPFLGQKEYKFPVKSFFETLLSFESTEGDGHVFEITIEDQNGNKISDTLYVIVE